MTSPGAVFPLTAVNDAPTLALATRMTSPGAVFRCSLPPSSCKDFRCRRYCNRSPAPAVSEVAQARVAKGVRSTATIVKSRNRCSRPRFADQAKPAHSPSTPTFRKISEDERFNPPTLLFLPKTQGSNAANSSATPVPTSVSSDVVTSIIATGEAAGIAAQTTCP